MEGYKHVDILVVLIITTSLVLAEETHVTQESSPSPNTMHLVLSGTNGLLADTKTTPDSTVKATAAVKNATKTDDKKSVEETYTSVKNMIVVPPNCPDGYKADADGVCRQALD